MPSERAGRRCVGPRALQDLELTGIQIFEMFTNLFLHSLLPTSLLQMEDFLSGASVIPLQGNAPSQPQPRGDGLLSALSSYLMTPYSSNEQVPEATDSDVESTLCTIDCITSCRLDELYSQIMWVLVLMIYREANEP